MNDKNSNEIIFILTAGRVNQCSVGKANKDFAKL